MSEDGIFFNNLYDKAHIYIITYAHVTHIYVYIHIHT